MKIKYYLYKYKYIIILLSGLFIWYLFSLPDPLFDDPTSTVIEDKEGQLLGARIAGDGQWRFPQMDTIPEKFEKCILQFEDRFFYYHPGFNPVSLIRALVQNIQAGEIVSGGSTLTMQVIRLSRKGKSRTIYEKIVEIILSTRLELSCRKKKILTLYASNAPFGGNIVGFDAAAWRYFGRESSQLSWAETATLAVLPNAPSLIYPGKNQSLLLEKRNRLLNRLFFNNIIDSVTCELAKLEPLPGKPFPLPQTAPHLLSRIAKKHKGERITTTIEENLQKRVNQIIETHHHNLRFNEIHNAAAIILDVESGNVLAYVGNTSNPGQPEHGSYVDIISAPRSTGSIMKPILFAAMLNDGELLPNTLVPDVPTQISGYSPKNFNLSYDGAVPAKRALARSLNVPAVRMLQNYGVERFFYLLKKLDMSTIRYSSDHYGLSIILGGAEATLFDLTGIYASFSRILNNYFKLNGKYDSHDLKKPNYILNNTSNQEIKKNSNTLSSDFNILSASAIWLTYESLIEVNRPPEEASWEFYSSAKKIAWKTGTSFGFRDGWAIGTTSRYVVGVWVGNADGEGRPGLTGLGSAAPVLFDIFDLLPDSEWFPQPYDEMKQVAVCRHSGHRAGINCEIIDTIWIPVSGLKSRSCPYHYLVHLNKDKKYRVSSICEDINEMVHQKWFVLPPVQEWFYKSKNPSYRLLPPYKPGCEDPEGLSSMDLIYPKQTARIYIPVELDGTKGKVVFEVAHRESDAIIYWHLDNTYIGLTKHIHQMGLAPEKGQHILTLVDEDGKILHKSFEIISGS